MNKIYLMVGAFFVSISCSAAPAGGSCQVDSKLQRDIAALMNATAKANPSELTRNQMDDICSAILNKTPPTKIGVGISYAYQEKLWIFSGLTPIAYIRHVLPDDASAEKKTQQRKDDRAEMDQNMKAALPAIQRMWLASREKFTCSNTSNLANGKNILKYVLESGFTSFLTDSRYKLDVNFVDPTDHLTLLDYIEMRKAQIRTIDPEKYQEFSGIAEDLRNNRGALNGAELAASKP